MSFNNRILAASALVFLCTMSTSSPSGHKMNLLPRLRNQTSATGLSADDLLLSKPETPEQLMQAVVQLTDLGHAASAKPYLEQLLKANLDNEMVLKFETNMVPLHFFP